MILLYQPLHGCHTILQFRNSLYHESYCILRAEKLPTCAISFSWNSYSYRVAHRIVSRMIDGVVLLTENLAPTYSVYVPSKFVTERTLASTVNSRLNSKEKQREREKSVCVSPRFVRFTRHRQSISSVKRESRPNTGRLTKFRVNTMMHRLIHPNCA